MKGVILLLCVLTLSRSVSLEYFDSPALQKLATNSRTKLVRNNKNISYFLTKLKNYSKIAAENGFDGFYIEFDKYKELNTSQMCYILSQKMSDRKMDFFNKNINDRAINIILPDSKIFNVSEMVNFIEKYATYFHDNKQKYGWLDKFIKENYPVNSSYSCTIFHENLVTQIKVPECSCDKLYKQKVHFEGLLYW